MTQNGSQVSASFDGTVTISVIALSNILHASSSLPEGYRHHTKGLLGKKRSSGLHRQLSHLWALDFPVRFFLGPLGLHPRFRLISCLPAIFSRECEGGAMGSMGAGLASPSFPPYPHFLFFFFLPLSPSFLPSSPTSFLVFASLFNAPRWSVSMWSSPPPGALDPAQMQPPCQMLPREGTPPPCGDRHFALSHRSLE